MSQAMFAEKSNAQAAKAKAACRAGSSNLRIGEPDDAFEREADWLADEIIDDNRPKLDWSISRMSIAAPLQRKCACGGSGGASGQCEGCKEKEEEKDNKTLRRKAAGPAESNLAPPIVHEVLNSPGQPLDRAIRDFFEPRFGHDFSQVRIYVDDRAAESARAVHARAYTIGSSIVFGAEQYRPRNEEGHRLIAHELAHTLQQRVTVARSIAKDDPSNPNPQGGGLSPLLTPLTGQAAAPTQAAPPNIPPRGANPADCMTSICDRISHSSPPANESQAHDLGQRWVRGALACIRGGAQASRATHATEIVANEETEIPDEIRVLNDDFDQQSRSRSRFQDYRKDLLEDCQHRTREVQLEFNYNVVFENPSGGSPKWGYNPDWDEVEGALSALPIEATWGNPHLLRFRRDSCHPADVDPRTGQCTGHGGGSVGGMTEDSSNAANRITIYDAGVGQSPYSRSASLRIPATSQTLRHEVGHVMDELVPADERIRFFEGILHWHEYPWDWIGATGSGVPQSWQNERNQLMQATGMRDAALTQWLNSLQINVPVEKSGITYTKEPVSLGASSYKLHAYQTDQMPQGREFEYARTNQGDYFAEVYTLAVSRPDFLSGVLPAAQSAWLRRVVFHTPEDLKALAQQAALREPERTRFLVRGQRLYTREQLDQLINELSIRSRNPGAQLA